MRREPRARAQPPPYPPNHPRALPRSHTRARPRAPTPHSSGFRAGEVGLASGRPNQRRGGCRPLPSPCAPARGRGLRAGPGCPGGAGGRLPGGLARLRGVAGPAGVVGGIASPSPTSGLGLGPWSHTAPAPFSPSCCTPTPETPGLVEACPAGPAQARVSPSLHLRLQPGLPIHWAPALSPLVSSRGQGYPPLAVGLTWGLGLGSSKPQAPSRRGRR